MVDLECPRVQNMSKDLLCRVVQQSVKAFPHTFFNHNAVVITVICHVFKNQEKADTLVNGDREIVNKIFNYVRPGLMYLDG